MVIMGFLSEFLELKPEAWTENIRRRLPAKFLESSLKAFSRGVEEAKAMRLAKGVKK
jgi:Pyruvate/2-oxoacid:ferredoxin oxidoreductase gamma subunit